MRLAEDCSRSSVNKTKTSYKTGGIVLVLSFIHSFSLKSIRQLAIYHSSGPWQSALKSFRQDSRGHKPEKEKPTTPGIGLQYQVNPLTQKLTTPPLRRQSKQVTILKLQTPRCHLTNFTAPHALPAAFLSCTLACWSRSRYLFSPQCLLASSAQLTSQVVS